MPHILIATPATPSPSPFCVLHAWVIAYNYSLIFSGASPALCATYLLTSSRVPPPPCASKWPHQTFFNCLFAGFIYLRTPKHLAILMVQMIRGAADDHQSPKRARTINTLVTR